MPLAIEITLKYYGFLYCASSPQLEDLFLEAPRLIS